MNEKSCQGCVFLYFQDVGYSDYSVTDTEEVCAHDRNPNLPAERPYARDSGDVDLWDATNASRCELYRAGEQLSFSVEGEDDREQTHPDPEVQQVIWLHKGVS